MITLLWLAWWHLGIPPWRIISDARGSTEDEAVGPAADLVAPPPGEG